MAMSTIPLFARDFDAEIAGERSRSADTSPSEAEIAAMVDAAREQGRDEGVRDGREQARLEFEGSVSAMRVAALDALAPRLDRLIKDQDAHRARVEAELASLLYAICENAVPHVLERHGGEYLRGEINRIVRRAQGSRWLEIRVSPEHRGDVEAILRGLLPDCSEQRDLRVLADRSLGTTEIAAGWQGGSSRWSHERLCRAILEELSRDLPASPSAEEKPQ